MNSEVALFDLLRTTVRRAESIMVDWGSLDDFSENARACECLGWNDLAERWRSMIAKGRGEGQEGPQRADDVRGGIPVPPDTVKGSESKETEGIW